MKKFVTLLAIFTLMVTATAANPVIKNLGENKYIIENGDLSMIVNGAGGGKILSFQYQGQEVVSSNKVSKDKLGLDLNKNKKLVLIVMGSLGSTTMNKKLKDTLPLFENKDYEVVFVTGKNYYD